MKNEKGKCLLIILFIFSLFIFIYFNNFFKKAKSNIGIILPINSKHSKYIENGVKLSILKTNRFNYKLIDIKNISKEKIDKYIAFIGPLFSDNYLKIAPFISKNKIPIICPSTIVSGISQLNEYCFSHSYTYENEAKISAKMFFSKLGKNALIIIKKSSEYSNLMSDLFKKEFEMFGGETKIMYLKEINNYMEEKNIYIPLDIETAKKVIDKLGYKKNYIGCSLWENQIEPDLEKRIHYPVILNKTNKKIEKFVNNYKNKFKSTPNYLSLMAYESMELIKEAAFRGGFTKQGVYNGLYRLKNFNAISGKLSVSVDGSIPCNFSWKGKSFKK